MHPAIRSVLAVLAGFAVGSVVNMGIILFGGTLIPPPDGADVTTAAGLTASLHLFEPRHFIMPFLAHALGTFAGALVAALVAIRHKRVVALIIAVLFLAGGVANVVMLPSPLWFSITDLLLAYLPMGYLAGWLMDRK